MAAQSPAINIEDASLITELRQYANAQAIQELISEVSGQQPPKHATIDELLQQVEHLVASQSLSSDRVSSIVREYKFAGNVSVCWGIPLKYIGFSKTQLENLLQANREGNPFESELRPQLTQKPAFNQAEWLSNTKLRLEFTYAGKAYDLEDNYEFRRIIPTRRINVYLRLLKQLFVIETHGNIRETKQVHQAISRLLGVEVTAMTFSNQDITFLKRELKAKTKASKFKRLGGEIDTVYVSAAPDLDDLENSEEFRQKFSDGDLRETRLEFVYTKKSGNQTNTSIHISHLGNIWFMTDVPEEVIEYVFSVVRKVKFLPPLTQLGRSSKAQTEVDNQIESLLAAIHTGGYGKRFSPRIYLTLGLQVDERLWMEAISKLLQAGFLSERFELCCPACHETIAVYQRYQDIPLDRKVTCNHCGNTFTVSEQDIFLVYAFKDDLVTQSNKSVIDEASAALVRESLAK
jgi:DNA-directed RNA polymerase subunit M/transcription elongation factor TFIIS